MTTAKTGDTVKVHYTGKLDSGDQFDSSVEREPLEFTIGKGQLLKPFEEAVVGMTPGDSTSIQIPPESGYGLKREELTGEIPRERLPEDLSPEVGMQLQMQTPQGQSLVVTVTDVSESAIGIDGNHPLAGENLNFDIELLEIV